MATPPTAIRTRLTMRASVHRDVGTARDPYGSVAPSEAQSAAPLSCYIQPRTESTISTDGKFLSATALRLWAARDANLENEDIVADVTDRAGRVLYDGRYRIVSLVRRETHAEAMLEAYG